jgi:predicted AlkP superfamily phosphohydrolase/phosphomutase
MRDTRWDLFCRAFLISVALMILVSGCGVQEKSVDPEAGKLLVIGIDSADWRLLEPMMDEGRLPNLKAFMAQANHGRMKTFFPLEKSPLLWASILTGVRPEVHGIANFVKGSGQKPVTGSAWFAPALWDMIGAAGRSTAVAGMWTTYPARPINGVMVSDYLPYGRDRNRPLANLVYPDSLAEKVVAQRVAPEDLAGDVLLRFLNTDDLEAVEEKFPRDISKLREILAADMSYLAVSRMLKKSGDFDLFFFYLRGPDMISHHFYKFLTPDRGRAQVNPEAVAIFKDVVKRYYDWSDEVLGEVLSWFPPERQAVVLSDHGFYGPRSSGDKGTNEHSEWGIFLVRSPLYEAGHQFGHLELLDICPTFLALMGLPPAADMPGRILTDGATGPGLKRIQKMEKQRVDSYLPLRPAVGPEGERDEGVDEEIRKQLRSLGYIK